MKSHSALLTIDKETKLGTEETSKLHEGELIVEPLFVGVCGTDLQIIRRQRPDPATILGHEGIGRVLEGSNEEKDIHPGGYIVFNPVDPTDQNQF